MSGFSSNNMSGQFGQQAADPQMGFGPAPAATPQFGMGTGNNAYGGAELNTQDPQGNPVGSAFGGQFVGGAPGMGGGKGGGKGGGMMNQNPGQPQPGFGPAPGSGFPLTARDMINKSVDTVASQTGLDPAPGGPGFFGGMLRSAGNSMVNQFGQPQGPQMGFGPAPAQPQPQTLSQQDRYSAYAKNVFGGGDSIYKPDFNPAPAQPQPQQPANRFIPPNAPGVRPGIPVQQARTVQQTRTPGGMPARFARARTR